jgi:hypothetical protein
MPVVVALGEMLNSNPLVSVKFCGSKHLIRKDLVPFKKNKGFSWRNL